MEWNWRDPALALLRLWWRLRRPTTIGVRGIVADETGRILFVRHNYGRRLWFLPGGGGHGAETAAESVARELREETGLEVEVERLVGVYLYTGEYKRDHNFVFACRILGGSLKIDGAEIAQAGWFPPGALPQPLTPGVGQVLADWQSGRVGLGRWGE